MKAILVVDLPNNVNMDRVIQTPVTLSFSLGDGIKQILFADGYLKPLPSHMELESNATQTKAIKIDNSFRMGWNMCLGEILGETE